ncbi:hypothetical protein FGO68_gene11421 [Halteria grandinella]|uniref:Uncharacterized protein n=1 Tax=Halteria grandinella TaxID=5974 RepID=A0A8J8NL69_HALGN|nr:hypothetical protein FGO68_gene11421 [Halteria grandinella]
MLRFREKIIPLMRNNFFDEIFSFKTTAKVLQDVFAQMQYKAIIVYGDLSRLIEEIRLRKLKNGESENIQNQLGQVSSQQTQSLTNKQAKTQKQQNSSMSNLSYHLFKSMERERLYRKCFKR